MGMAGQPTGIVGSRIDSGRLIQDNPVHLSENGPHHSVTPYPGLVPTGGPLRPDGLSGPLEKRVRNEMLMVTRCLSTHSGHQGLQTDQAS